jgi:hypothetical protein
MELFRNSGTPVYSNFPFEVKKYKESIKERISRALWNCELYNFIVLNYFEALKASNEMSTVKC